MSIDFRNTNSVWASILAETLVRLGLRMAVVCPGSRSTPLAIAFAQHPEVEAIPVLDERSAAFFALGLARQSGLPVVLVCTSGTAGANFYPAVIEARQSRVPLLVLTADRPPELRDCNAGQAIDQQKLFGDFPNWYAELATPALEVGLLRYLRQTMIYAWERSLWPVAGPVHLNLPLREPLAPIPDPAVEEWRSQFDSAQFFAAVQPITEIEAAGVGNIQLPLATWQACERGVIIAGPAQPRSPVQYCTAVAQLSAALGWPVLAEGLSPLRNYADLNPELISTYDLLLRNRQLAEQLAPAMVIRIGEMPTSKELRLWLERVQPQQWIVDPGDRNLDPLHGYTIHLRLVIEQLAPLLPPTSQSSSSYFKDWCSAEGKVRQKLDQTMSDTEAWFEGKVAWLLSQHLPPGTPLFIANSMPVRDVEFFWKPGNTAIKPYFNRGANGIDGTLSTALGMAHGNQSSVLLTGDLALLHDTNGFLLRNKLVGHLTIIVVNNNGGGIFEMLPIAQFEQVFEEFFATPQAVDFMPLCQAYGVEYELIQTWPQLIERLNPLPQNGIRVLEVRTDRKVDSAWRRANLAKFAVD
ncbi:2-succinyl-5-enolpyruvyl-6-hydroxy-3-cyclohexene-1-carboxylic-acid synthase [Trichocoleus sp. FACHB-591]|uniref:2-succinyl-5-enolpyruvyl-6-hydroxy-3- cyclohexene-1-carboxylic-acid synthase n=1 Tax=Trichocoleus sp. FACHB-591 TaxID=2692872 RepID=UPI001687CF28|nr:2-succinyl-5-enolpyruvyl-6-hydroxy-3-cyclohexene-1-carboxylic-acid synthase [Trichocoleus sp. FACHB-591]MBD2095152.1 2-succinyl-5-enolpyruvyl-6-hydroxy-3-cyclohexene-1-carboxylic-acid synthase [Trichocoleus sp. FACHB-591]